MPSNEATRFVKYIVDCADNPGSRSALRSGLSRDLTQADRMHAFVAPWTSSSKPHTQAVYYTIAALVAHKPNGALTPTSPGNIGASLAACTALAAGTRETTLRLLARQPSGQLCRMLTRVVVQLRNADTPVDFPQLLDDAASWPWRYQTTRTRWLQSYYRTAD